MKKLKKHDIVFYTGIGLIIAVVIITFALFFVIQFESIELLSK